MKTILVIDDDADHLASLSGRLGKLPETTVETAACGSEALQRLQKRRDAADEVPFNLIIIDMWVPVLQGRNQRVDELFGLKLIRLLKSDLSPYGSRVPVLVFTAHPDVETCRAAFLAGAIDYIPKIDPKIGDAAAQTDSLMRRVKEVFLIERENRPLNVWYTTHVIELHRRYKGKWIAPVESTAAEAAGIKGELFGNYTVLLADERAELVKRVFDDPFLALENPPIYGLAPQSQRP